MKKHILFALVFATQFLLAQNENDKKVFLDSLWKETTEGNHKYFRIIKDYSQEKDSYQIFDYFKNGQIQMEGTFKDKKATIKKGTFVYYYENGNKQMETHFNELEAYGDYKDWYPNGNIRTEAYYEKNDNSKKNIFIIVNSWDADNNQTVANKNGILKQTKDTFTITGEIKNGVENGIWKGEDSKTKRHFIEEYKNGKLKKGKSVSPDTNETYSYKELEKPAFPKKGMSHFVNYLVREMKASNPKIAISGRILAEFIVEKDGSIKEVTLLESIHKELDSKAIESLKSYNGWESGKMRGIPVRVKFTLPLRIDFKVI